jgi:hypothetical protein
MNIPTPILVRNIPVCYLVAQLWRTDLEVNDEMYDEEGGSPTLEEYCQNYATRADVLEDLGNEITVTEDTTLEALIQDLGTDFAESLQGVEFSANKDYSAETSVQAIESTPIEA